MPLGLLLLPATTVSWVTKVSAVITLQRPEAAPQTYTEFGWDKPG